MIKIDLEQFVNAIPNPVFIKDSSHRWVMVNDSFCELMGKSKDELMDRTDSDFLPKDEYELFYKRDLEVLNSGKSSTNREEITLFSGSRYSIISKKSRITIDDKHYVLVVVTDISDFSNFEEMLKVQVKEATKIIEEQRVFLQGVVDMIPEIFFVKDSRKRNIIINNAYADFLGMKKSDVLYKRDDEFLPQEEAKQCSQGDETILQGGEEKILSQEVFGKDESRGVFRVLKQLLEVGNDRYVVGIAEDITDLVDTKESLQRLNNSLQEQIDTALSKERESQELIHIQSRFSAVGELLHNLSHHWRQPLSVITIKLSMMSEKLRHDEELTQDIELVIKEAQSISDTLNMFSKSLLQQNGSSDIGSVIDDLLALIKPQLEKDSIEVILDVGGRYTTKMQYAQLKQILLSILQNSIDAIEKKDIQEGVISISTKEEGAFYQIQVDDDGVGIDSEMISYAFEPYTTSKFKSRNIGLSLFLCKKYLDMVGGSINLKQRSEGGTRVTIEIPKP
jgi:PAS domain S-box-containing protein